MVYTFFTVLTAGACISEENCMLGPGVRPLIGFCGVLQNNILKVTQVAFRLAPVVR